MTREDFHVALASRLYARFDDDEEARKHLGALTVEELPAGGGLRVSQEQTGLSVEGEPSEALADEVADEVAPRGARGGKYARARKAGKQAMRDRFGSGGLDPGDRFG